MINYLVFELEDFITDDYFRDWVLNPQSENAIFWKQWIDNHPEKSELIELARLTVKSIHEHYSEGPAIPDFEQKIARISNLAEENKAGRSLNISRPFRTGFIRIAASVTLALGLGWYLVRKNPTLRSDISVTAASETITRKNDSNREMTVLMPDGSTAILSKGSLISYPKHFDGSIRRVDLSGEAFFDVTPDKQKPFIIYTAETVVKVLGTSFRVRAFDEDDDMVFVRTGKVSVYPKSGYTNSEKDQNKAVILAPNQQVIFKSREHRLEKSSVKNPLNLNEYHETTEVIFDDIPVPQIFHSLESLYGVTILFDSKALQKCFVSAQFKEESLRQRMHVICQAIDASFDTVDGQIVVKSNGCN